MQAAERRYDAATQRAEAVEARLEALALGCLAPTERRARSVAAARASLARARASADAARVRLLALQERAQAGRAGAPAPAVGAATVVVVPRPTGSPERIPARFEVVSARAVIPSHDPIAGFAARPDYPEQTQERDYARQPQEQLKVDRIASALIPGLIASTNPGAVDGSPIVDQDGIVISGNGRTMAVQLAYHRGQGSELIAYLRQHARTFGLRASELARFSDPILIRRIVVPAKERARLVRVTNAALTQVVAPEDIAAARGRLAEAAGIGRVIGEHDGHTTSSSSAWIREHGAALLPALERAGLITESDRIRWVSRDGGLRARAVDDVAEALAAAVLPAGAEGGELARPAIVRSALGWLAAAQAGGAWDVRPSLRRAVADLSRMRASGLRRAKYERQTGITARPTDGDPIALTLFDVFDRAARRPLVMARIAQSFATASQAGGGLFGASTTPIDALRAAVAEHLGAVSAPRATPRRARTRSTPA